MTARQRQFNTRLSSVRVKIEQAFGLLKGKWRRLLSLSFKTPKLNTIFIIACCVLHNIGIDCEFYADVWREEDDGLVYDYEQPEQGAGNNDQNQNGADKRNRLMNAAI